MLLRTFNSYLKATYGCEVAKLCLDGGFTCPNRDGTVGTGGCTFCGECGAGEHLHRQLSIREQVERYFARPHRQKKFIAYFQSFTGTYAPPEVLRARYREALCDERIVAVAIGTRPDCLAPEVIEVLRELKEETDVWVELGLQTSHDGTASAFRRGYETRVFDEACDRLRAAQIPFAVHILLGLPGEGPADALSTVRHVAAKRPFGVKLHSLYVLEGTDLADDYRAGRYLPMERETYIETVIEALTLLPPETVILRLMADAPRDRLLAPPWNVEKDYVHREIRRRMQQRGLSQGMRYEERVPKA